MAMKNWYIAIDGEIIHAGEHVCEPSEEYHAWAEDQAEGGEYVLIYAEDEEEADYLCHLYDTGQIEVGSINCPYCGGVHAALSIDA